MGGTPEEVLASRELMDFFLPALRADLALAETQSFRVDDGALACPLQVFAAEKDGEVSAAGLLAWRAETRGPFEVTRHRGGHFALLGEGRAVVQEALSAALARDLGRGGQR
jgi:medium-chain acyl-[acyl-carrier-protein] hydrolase